MFPPFEIPWVEPLALALPPPEADKHIHSASYEPIKENGKWYPRMTHNMDLHEVPKIKAL